jgi:hypothetical protein
MRAIVPGAGGSATNVNGLSSDIAQMLENIG